MPEKVLTRMEIVWKEDKASPGKSTLIEYIARTSMAFRALVGQVLQALGATLPTDLTQTRLSSSPRTTICNELPCGLDLLANP